MFRTRVLVKRDCSGNYIAGMPLILVVFCSSEFVRASHTLDGTLHALEPPRATDPRRGVEGRRMRDLQRGGGAQLPGGEVHGGSARRCVEAYQMFSSSSRNSGWRGSAIALRSPWFSEILLFGVRPVFARVGRGFALIGKHPLDQLRLCGRRDVEEWCVRALQLRESFREQR